MKLLEAVETKPAGKDLGNGYIEATVPRHLVRTAGGLEVYKPNPYVFRTTGQGIFERAHYPGGRIQIPGITTPVLRRNLGLPPY